MTRLKLRVRFALAAMQGRAGTWDAFTKPDDEARKCWTIADAAVRELPQDVADGLDPDALPALQASRVAVLVAEDHPYCERPRTIKHPDRPDEVRGEPQCERCAALTPAAVESLGQRLEVRTNNRKAQRQADFEERARKARERRRRRDQGDEDGEGAVVV